MLALKELYSNEDINIKTNVYFVGMDQPFYSKGLDKLEGLEEVY